MAKATRHMIKQKQVIKSQNRRTSFVFGLFFLVSLLAFNPALVNAATGVMVGSDSLILGSGENIYYGAFSPSSNTGASGILLQSPAGNNIFRLDTLGNVTATGTVKGMSGLCIGNDCRTAWDQVGGAYWNLSGSNLFASSTSWNLGIGLTNPTAKLQVSGATGFINGGATQLSLLGGAGNVMVMSDNTGTLYSTTTSAIINPIVTSASGWTANGTTVYKTDVNGNVGIGTTNPGAKLDIIGKYSSSSPTVRIIGSPDSGGYDVFQVYWRDISGKKLLGLKSATGADSIMSGVTEIEGLSKLSLTQMGDTSANSAISISSHNVLIGYSGGINGGFFSVQANAPLVLKTNNIERIRIKNDGNVGIGTTAPGTKLDITGTLRNSLATTHSLLGGSGNVLVMADNTGTLYGVTTPEGTATLPTGTSGYTLRHNGTAWISNSNLYNNGTNIGIGTTAPLLSSNTKGLVIAGAAGRINAPQDGTERIPMLRITDTVTDYGSGTATIGEKRGGIEFYSSETSYGFPGISSAIYTVNEGASNGAQGLAFYTTPTSGVATERMRITNTGYVGFGNSNPSYPLTVGSTMAVLNSSTVAGSASSLILVDKNNDSIRIKGIYHANEDMDIAFNRDFTGAGNSDLLTIKGGTGNVGIGLTNPTAKFQISGATGFINGGATQLSLLGGAGNVMVMSDNTGTLYSTTTAAVINPIVTSASGWTANGTTVYKTDVNGNVGIGTTNPGDKLDVNGSMRVTAFSGTYLDRYAKFTQSGYDGGPLSLSFGGSGTYASYLDIQQTHPYYGFLIHKGSGWGGQGLYGANNDFGISVGVTTQDIVFNGGNFQAANEIMRLKGTGNVGIGTTNPIFKLDVDASSIGARINGTYGSLQVGNPAVGSELVYGDQSMAVNSNNLYLKTNSLTRLFIANAGNVGIGTTNPTNKLDVVGTGTFRNDNATTHSLLGGSGTVVVMADNNGTLYATSSSALLGNYLPLTGGALSGNLNMSGNNILGINKLTVTTIDPLYRIKGTNYSTYASSVVGGVKEEYLGRLELKKTNSAGEYEYIVDFAKQKEGSDLWVWRKTVDFSEENVDVLMTTYGRFAQVYYLIEGEKLIFRSDKPTTVSYRLAGKRVDWRLWPTKAVDQQETPGFIIE